MISSGAGCESAPDGRANPFVHVQKVSPRDRLGDDFKAEISRRYNPDPEFATHSLPRHTAYKRFYTDSEGPDLASE